MSQSNSNQQMQQKTPMPVFNQAYPPHNPVPLTDVHVKEVVMETLIELNLIQRTQRKKGIKLE